MSRSSQPRLFEQEPAPDPWERAAESDHLVAAVVFNRPLDTVYHYAVPNELRDVVGPGHRVRVSFGRGNRLTTGYCVGVSDTASTSKRLKRVEEVLDREPLLSAEMLELTRWMSERYLCSWGQVLESVVPAGVKKQAGTREITCYHLPADIDERLQNLKLSAKQKAVIEALKRAGGPLGVDDITAAAECGTSPIQTLRNKKLVLPVRTRTEAYDTEMVPIAREDDLRLNRDQRAALDTIVNLLRDRKHETVLLHGVTGSGKTEVYIQAIREVVAYGKQAIVLVPEISLTPQTIRRFRSRFPNVAVLHSHLSDSERHWHWQRIARGEVQVVVGARSAVFAPTPQLGLIVIDEEHETTFKQQTTPRYHAREVARERARRESAPLILGSATPTLESLLRVHRRQDVLINLPTRVESRPLPPVVTVDTRNDPQVAAGQSLGRALQNGMRVALRDGGQVILFLNLRGFSPVLWCRRCGEGLKCPHCDITLTWHKDRGRVLCHSCEHEAAPPPRCPKCDWPGLKYLGAGTQRLEQEVRAKFPDHKCLRMDSDSMRKRGSHDEALESFREGKVQILLGTQMIAKGLDFPNVTLVGVVDADTLLHQPDLRASERTFQLIAQVAGRTGRGDKGGRVLVQTSCPDEPVIRKAAQHDYSGFAMQELRHRKEMDSPPFTHLARIILRGPVEQVVQSDARRIAEQFREAARSQALTIRILGPAPAPITKLRNQYRYHFQIAAEIPVIQQLWHAVRRQIEPAAEVEFTIDVDPLDMR